MGALGGGGEGGQFRVDLEEELVEFAEFEGSVLLGDGFEISYDVQKWKALLEELMSI